MLATRMACGWMRASCTISSTATALPIPSRSTPALTPAPSRSVSRTTSCRSLPRTFAPARTVSSCRAKHALVPDRLPGDGPGLGTASRRLAACLEHSRRGVPACARRSPRHVSVESARCAAGMVLAANPAITAVICANDLMAVRALRALRDRGLRVPHDISVTGFDNIKLACSATLH